MKLKTIRNNKGFTLIEIIVVLVIMVIMAAIAVPAVTGYIKDAKDSEYIQDTRAIYTIVQTEEAKYKALNESADYGAIVEKVNDKMDDASGVEVTSVANNSGKYTIQFTANGKAVTAVFTKNSDDMTITYE